MMNKLSDRCSNESSQCCNVHSKYQCSMCLQFTSNLAFCCVFHRSTSQVIHCLEQYVLLLIQHYAIHGLKDYGRRQSSSSLNLSHLGDSSCAYGVGVQYQLSLDRYPKPQSSHEYQLGNDPLAGSPTRTLLRLLCGLNHQLQADFQNKSELPKSSVNGSIPHSDGRCVQRAGT